MNIAFRQFIFLHLNFILMPFDSSIPVLQSDDLNE